MNWNFDLGREWRRKDPGYAMDAGKWKCRMILSLDCGEDSAPSGGGSGEVEERGVRLVENVNFAWRTPRMISLTWFSKVAPASGTASLIQDAIESVLHSQVRIERIRDHGL